MNGSDIWMHSSGYRGLYVVCSVLTGARYQITGRNPERAAYELMLWLNSGEEPLWADSLARRSKTFCVGDDDVMISATAELIDRLMTEDDHDR